MEKAIFQRIMKEIPKQITNKGISLVQSFSDDYLGSCDTSLEKLIRQRYEKNYIFNSNFGFLCFRILIKNIEYDVKLEFHKDKVKGVWHIYFTCDKLNIYYKRLARRKILPFTCINALCWLEGYKRNMCIRLDFHPRYFSENLKKNLDKKENS